MTARILLVQLADIGDLILTTPALAALREARPDAHLTLLTSAHAAPILEGTGLVDSVVTLERQQMNSSAAFFRPANLRRLRGLRREPFEAVVFFHHFTLKLGTLKFALIAWASGARRIIGLDQGNGWFLTECVRDDGFGARHQARYWLDLVARLGADSRLRSARVALSEGLPAGLLPAKGRRVVIHPGSGGYSLARRWDAARFAAVADRLNQEEGAEIVLVGGRDDGGAAVREAMQGEALDLTGKTSLRELAAVIRSADVFIGADSGVMHLAAAVGMPVVAIFGPSNADAWGPWTPEGRSRVVRSGVECSPCSYVGHGIGLREGCAARTCMRLVTADQVLAAARALLHSTGEPEAAPQAPIQAGEHERLRVLGFPVDAITYASWLERIGEWVKRGRPHHVCTINPEFIIIARQDANFANILRRAEMCVPDGVGLLWAARYLGRPLPERVTGSDGVPIIAERAAREGWKLFFLGAAPGVAERAARILQERHPGLQVVGTYAGCPDPGEEDDLVERVNASRADILFVAYGAPEQDKWIARNLPRLRVGMAMGVGGAFDFIAGVVPRAPGWMRRMGLEWAFRLVRQPWRLRRMLRLPRFVLAVVLRGKDG
ncbi:MAG: WecB/TagA/CpsF family glycosyltransferase [Anaerolineae bacterium]|nr:WecB/TagA/CpsF family glycosyltransferase [Anaerolineae bacterium]